MELDEDERYVDGHKLAFWFCVACALAVMAASLLLTIRLYRKAGADIQNPIELRRLAVAQERIAAALEAK